MTIKVPESKRYASDNPWFTFRGSDLDLIRAQVIKSLGLDAEEQQGLSLFEVVLNAQRKATNVGSAAQQMGGTVLKVEKSSGAESASVAESAPAAEPEGPHPLFAKIEEQTDVAALQRLWAENKAAFDADAALMDAYKVKGKALTA